MPDNKSLLKSTFQITFFTFFNIGLNFLLQLIIAFYYGTSYERDAYLASIVIPTYLNTVFAGSIGFIFLTKFQEAEKSGNKDILNGFLSYTFFLVTGLLAFLTLLGLIFSQRIIRFSVPGFNESQILYTSRLLAVVLPTTIFFNLSNLFSSVYQIKNRFLRPSFIPLIIPLTSILTVVLFTKKLGIFSLAYGFLAGTILSAILLSSACYIVKFKITFYEKSRKLFYSLIKNAFPLFLFGFIFKFSPVFERMIASGLESGSISYLGYSNQIMSILATVASSGIAVSMFPMMSKYWIENKKEEVGKKLVTGVRLVLLLTVPIALIMILWGDVFIKVLLERGVFTHKSTIAVSLCLSFMMGAFIFQSLGNIIVKVFYFSGKTWIISFIASFELVIYVILGFYLTKTLSYAGLALSLSISSGINIILSTLFINRYLVNLNLRKMAFDTGKILLVSFLSAFIMKKVFDLHLLDLNDTIYLGISILIGIVFLFLFGLLFRIEEFYLIKSLVLKKVFPKTEK